jgi:hypothetical protein
LVPKSAEIRLLPSGEKTRNWIGWPVSHERTFRPLRASHKKMLELVTGNVRANLSKSGRNSVEATRRLSGENASLSTPCH